ncbi:MAG: GntR family transcriptional regulator [Victivallales bacterium]|nr:GntR family transcriptional regulator [Victivallales bacterium]
MRNDSLVNQLIEKITDAILQGQLKPGDRMPSETELTAKFQVGKSSVRD